MRIAPALFEAFLKCGTKCHLRSLGETGSGNEYAEWVRVRDESYQREAARRLQEGVPETERVVAPPAIENLKTAQWRWAVDLVAQASSPASSGSVPLPVGTPGGTPGEPADGMFALQSRLHAVERIPPAGRGQPAQFVPLRFIYRNKLTKDDKLLLAFDAFALSEMLGRAVSLGKIIHGDDHATLKVKTSALAGEVRKRLGKITALLASPTPPDLVLNRHCAECEFQARCRKLAVEKDDLSLLANMSAKERHKLRSKGIFTVTQLSYTFRPRRRPKRLRDKREKYHHALKALAIREKKIHIVGSPELKIEGTPVYLDVEGLPDRDFYYLIGLRIGDGDSAVQHSLWADTVADEGKIWREFLAILETVEKPVLIHYGSYEADFLKQMRQRHGEPPSESGAAKAVQSGLNLLSHIFAQIYFPTFSNGLKEVARFIGFDWSDPHAAGTKAIFLRQGWEQTGQPSAKSALLTYNAEDCKALQRASEFLSCIHTNVNKGTTNSGGNGVVNADDLPREGFGYFGPNRFQLPELEEINRAAYWDYQREKVLVKTSKQLRPEQRKHTKRSVPRANKRVIWPAPPACPKCGEEKIYKHVPDDKTVFDLRFSKSGVKRWVTRFDFYRYRCTRCKAVLHNPERVWSREKFGWNLCAFVTYQVVELRLPQETVTSLSNRLFGFNFCRGIIHRLKVAAAEFYEATYGELLERIVAGHLVHADETAVDFKGRRGYIWAFTNLDEVAFVFAQSREADTVQSVLGDFKGVLVSDFYAAYDSIDCPQQKCLIHLIRDLNDDLMAEPFNEELKKLIADFTQLVRPMIATVDRYGLKARFLRKHKSEAKRFFEKLRELDLQSERARKCKTRLEKNQGSLFTFLDYDGVPWNNNNAEHAIKSFAMLRRVITGVTTEKGIREYLVLLSVCQTCKYMGVDFLDFLRSGEKDIHAFAESRRGRRRRSPTREPQTPPADERAEK